jgi:hypothetical protein
MATRGASAGLTRERSVQNNASDMAQRAAWEALKESEA